MTTPKRHPLDVHSSPAAPNVRSASMRKLGKDGAALTPTEQRKKDNLMRQFMRNPEGGGVGNSPEYKANFDLIDWGKG